jgi:hypothetical protein
MISASIIFINVRADIRSRRFFPVWEPRIMTEPTATPFVQVADEIKVSAD